MLLAAIRGDGDVDVVANALGACVGGVRSEPYCLTLNARDAKA